MSTSIHLGNVATLNPALFRRLGQPDNHQGAPAFLRGDFTGFTDAKEVLITQYARLHKLSVSSTSAQRTEVYEAVTAALKEVLKFPSGQRDTVLNGFFELLSKKFPASPVNSKITSSPSDSSAAEPAARIDVMSATKMAEVLQGALAPGVRSKSLGDMLRGATPHKAPRPGWSTLNFAKNPQAIR